MRAFAIDGFGQVGSIRELPDPVPGEGEVLVRVRAAGLSTTCIAVIAGMMKDYLEHRFPLVPGIDASGVVERVGPGVDGSARTKNARSRKPSGSSRPTVGRARC